MSQTRESRYLGKPVKRIEDSKLLQGKGAYLDDLKLEGTLHLALVRSPFAHARILSVDGSAALQLPGVAAVYAAADLPELHAPGSAGRNSKTVNHPLLARDMVHYVGQPVVAVLASSAALAADAAFMVMVDYELLEALVDPLSAIDAAPIHAELASNTALYHKQGQGDVEAAFAQAHKVVKAHIVQQRLAGNPLEPRGTLASWDSGANSLKVWASTQFPHDHRDAIAELMGLSKNQVRLLVPDVGGGFGVKIHPYPEDLLAAYLARAMDKPVKWVEKRSESFMATSHGRAQVADLEMALSPEGKILGVRGRVVADMGAFILDTTAGSAPGTLLMLQGPYEIPAVQAELFCTYTTTTPTGAYRGAGRPEATFYLERLMDIAARELKMDPAELRLKNFIQGPFPYTTRMGAKYDSGAYQQRLEKLLEIADYRSLRAEQAQARAEGRLVGIGIASYVEITGFGWESGGVRVNADGTAVIFTGTSPHGQGGATSFAQIVAERLGIAIEQIQVVHGDTLTIPFGMGTAGSRTLQVGGSAILKAAESVEDKMRKIAAHLLEAAPQDMDLSDEGWTVQGVPEKAISVQKIAQAAYNPRKLPGGMDPGLEAQATFTLEESTFPFGSHLMMVEVDPHTGAIQILRFVSLDDAGTVVNPMLLEGQQQGGIAQGLGQALWEGIVYNESGQLITGSLMEYAMPKSDMIPWLEPHYAETASPNNPLGAKGIGEAGAIGSTPAAVNAVLDALDVSHLDMPLTAEKLWQALRG
jgi:carbon-monoxide dehydrogenase large subunit